MATHEPPLRYRRIRLETAEGKFVSYADPMLPLAVERVVVWGSRIFLLHETERSLHDAEASWPVYREVMPTAVVEE